MCIFIGYLRKYEWNLLLSSGGKKRIQSPHCLSITDYCFTFEEYPARHMVILPQRDLFEKVSSVKTNRHSQCVKTQKHVSLLSPSLCSSLWLWVRHTGTFFVVVLFPVCFHLCRKNTMAYFSLQILFLKFIRNYSNTLHLLQKYWKRGAWWL